MPARPRMAAEAPPRLQAPAWQAHKVVPDAITVAGGRLHTVKPGETGIAIARAYGVAWRRLADANKLLPPFNLQVGQKLLLPSAAAVEAMGIEARARAFNLDIDDIITGGAAAARPSPAPASRTTTPAARTPAAGTSAAPAAGTSAGAPSGNRFEWPVSGRILSGFGPKPGGRFNDGVNLKATAGAPVRAAAAGIIAYAGDGIPGFGNLVLIKHADGYVTAYAHNQALLVTRDRRVERGDVIARAGATGAVSEPQVHFELRRDRVPIDPTKVIGGR